MPVSNFRDKLTQDNYVSEEDYLKAKLAKEKKGSKSDRKLESNSSKKINKKAPVEVPVSSFRQRLQEEEAKPKKIKQVKR